MNLQTRALTGCVLALFCFAVVSPVSGDTAQPTPFDYAGVHFEKNVTDGDAEVVFEVTSGNEGLMRLTVVSPDGRTIIDFTVPDGSNLGIRSFQFESPEPKDIEGLKAAYPEGRYVFTGKNIAGVDLHGEATLRHQPPTPATVIQPVLGAVDLDAENVVISWTPVGDAVTYVVEIDQDELDMKLKARLPGSASRFPVPAGMLVRGKEYELSIATESPEGNLAVSETTFTTSK